MLKKILKKYISKYALAVILLIIMGVVEALSALGIAPIIDILINKNIEDASAVTLKLSEMLSHFGLPVTIITFMCVYLAIICGKNLLNIITHWYLSKLNMSIQKEITIDLFRTFMNSGWQFFILKKIGKLGNTLTSEVGKIVTMLEDGINITSNGIRVIFYTVLALTISWKLTTLIVITSVILLLPFLLIGKIGYSIGKEHTSLGNEYQTTIYESLNSAKLIIGYGNQNKSIIALSEKYGSYLKAAVKYLIFQNLTPTLYEPVMIMTSFFAIYLGINYFNIELSLLIVLLYVLRNISTICMQIVQKVNGITNRLPAIEQINNLSDEAKNYSQYKGTKKIESIKYGVKLKHVSFSYDNDKTVLNDINLFFPKNNIIALVGPSGGGKTTIVDILAGFYRVDSGEVEVDSVMLDNIDIESWRKKIGLVPQEPILFHSTIKENLLWSKSDASEIDMVNACSMANAIEFIDLLPKGLDTVVGEKGVRLSGGQRQRISLARAIIKEPELLILDEATSALDSKSELLIQKAIENISKKMTVIIIAHRFSTIKNANYIYVVNSGKVIESGTFSQLMEVDGGEFLNSAELQGYSPIINQS